MSGFLWGVATSAYQSEGGYNGPGQPQTNWAAAERKADVVAAGEAADFWRRYPGDFARCRSVGPDAFRLRLEWRRAPHARTDAPGPPPSFDNRALERYVDMLVH